MSEAAAASSKPKRSVGQIFSDAAKSAGRGGAAGAAAMAINVGSLMWIRTMVNYQYRYGTNTTTAFKTLWKEGGVVRFYRGLGPALIQGPLSRFGDTASNTGMQAIMESFEFTDKLPQAVKTVFASVGAATFRISLMPIDTFKTTMQVEGKDGITKLLAKFKQNGPSTFFQGALASAGATFVGHYPWFATYNYLKEYLPKAQEGNKMQELGRNAFAGFVSSFVSDCCSNSIRVVKVYKQANTEKISYPDAVRRVIQEDGIAGLFGRGLKTKIIANGLQGIMFSVLWNLIDKEFKKLFN